MCIALCWSFELNQMHSHRQCEITHNCDFLFWNLYWVRRFHIPVAKCSTVVILYIEVSNLTWRFHTMGVKFSTALISSIETLKFELNLSISHPRCEIYHNCHFFCWCIELNPPISHPWCENSYSCDFSTETVNWNCLIMYCKLIWLY